METPNIKDDEVIFADSKNSAEFLDSAKMRDAIFADLHIHSCYSRACSKNISFANLAKWGKIKGLDLFGTGDFSHPKWMEEIKKLKSNGKGFYYYGEGEDEFAFIVTGEISLIYTQGRGRRIHLVLLVPSVEVAEEINSYLDTLGRRDYDGRPIFKVSCEKFTEKMMGISEDIEVIPAHLWTPWFGAFGSCSGFDSLKECFGSQFENIHAIETGISSDPLMNWRIKELEGKAIVSFSDAHSFWPFRIGREATIFKKCDSYKELIRQIRENDFVGTVETDPSYGKYHYDGHRNCGYSCEPEKTKSLGGVCPICRRQLVVGVDSRVNALASNDIGVKPSSAKPYYPLLPLHEVIGLAIGSKMDSVKSWAIYNSLISEFGNEFNILLRVSRDEMLEKGVEENLVDLILKNREGNIRVKPGYDGVYGEAVVGKKLQRKLI